MLRKSSTTVKVFYPKYTKEDLLKLLGQRVPALKAVLPVEEMWLFGSYAKGRQTPSSDVDLLIVYEGANVPDAYKRAYHALDLKGVELHLYSHEEYERMLGMKPNPISTMLKGAIKIA